MIYNKYMPYPTLNRSAQQRDVPTGKGHQRARLALCRRRRESGANWPVRNWSVFWQGNCFKADCACHNRRSTFTMTLSPTREPSGFYAGLKEDLRTPPTAKNIPVVKNFNPKKTPINIQFHTVRFQPVSGRPRHINSAGGEFVAAQVHEVQVGGQTEQEA